MYECDEIRLYSVPILVMVTSCSDSFLLMSLRCIEFLQLLPLTIYFIIFSPYIKSINTNKAACAIRELIYAIIIKVLQSRVELKRGVFLYL